VKVAPVASTPELVSQIVFFVDRPQKSTTLSWFIEKHHRSKTLVFSRTKRGADKIARLLQRDGIRALAIHGNKSQSRRQAIIREFGSQNPPVLVATDLAARGLDFSEVAHVINYDLPDTPETYVHRIGRTARAGASGQAVTFCSHDERHLLRLIEKLTRQTVPVEQLPARRSNQHSSAPTPESGQTDAHGRDGHTEQQRAGQAGAKRLSDNGDQDKPRPHRGNTSRKSNRGKRRRNGRSSAVRSEVSGSR
jgi:ATP-dependent RNA helicase RhlE